MLVGVDDGGEHCFIFNVVIPLMAPLHISVTTGVVATVTVACVFSLDYVIVLMVDQCPCRRCFERTPPIGVQQLRTIHSSVEKIK